MKDKLNRRDFIKTAGVAATSFALTGCQRASRPRQISKNKKPNLLFIWTDEQRADTMAVYGNHKIYTPNLDKLASQSVVFQNAYVTQPVCTPNRAAVMTGLWPHTTGCTKNNVPLPENIPCLPEILNDPDYRTAYMGKWHLGDEIFAQHGFEEWVSIEYYSGYYRKGRDKTKKPDYHYFLEGLGYKPDRGDYFSRAFAAKRPIEHCKPKFLETKACEFLRRHRNEPFILNINFLEPHMPFFGPLDHIHSPADIDLPINFNDPLEENEPLRYRVLRECHLAQYGNDEKSFRRLISKYWGLVTQVDFSVGQILKTLEDLGLADNTIVVYTSDHGDMMGAHKMVEKCVMYEEAVKIPWLMRIPQMQCKQHIIKNPVSQIDLMPTLLDLMGAPYDNLPGQSLVPRIKGKPFEEDHVYIQWHPAYHALRTPPGGSKIATKEQIEKLYNVSTRTVISPDGFKLALSDIDRNQLFNLKNDPGETTNLFDSGQHKDIIKRLTDKIHHWQQNVNDNVKI